MLHSSKHFAKTKLSRKQFNFAKKPWIAHEILKSIKKQNKLFAKYQKTRSDANLKTYKSFRNKLTHQNETAKAMFFQKEIGKKKNISSTWNTINKILRKDKQNSSSLSFKLNVNGIFLTNLSSICFELIKYFCNIGHEMAKSIDKSSINANSQSFYRKRVSHSIYFEPTNDEEIVNIIKDLNPNKEPGYNDIPTKLIKAAAHSLSPFLSTIFNLCLESGHHPNKLKIALVTPLHKGGSKSEIKNYRPISIVSVFNKIFQTIIKRKLLNFWKKYNVFVSTQFGFRENHSTTLAIAHLNELIINDLDNNNSVCVIFLDLAKAFDTCNHKILLFKLDQYGIRGVANDVIRSYLTNRKQLVSGNGYSSSL